MHQHRLLPLTLILLALLAFGVACSGSEVTSVPTTIPETPAQPTETAAPETPTQQAPPTETATAPPTAPPPTEQPAADALCSQLGRPALVTQSQGQLSITNPLTGESCPLTLPGEWRGALQAGGGRLYFQDVEGEDLLIREISADGAVRSLDATRVNSAEHSLLGFAVSPDGSVIAWSTAALTGEPGMTSSLFIAQTSDGTVQPLIADLTREDMRGLLPLRFDDANQILVYTVQPYGIGGAWPSFVGRYDSLYTIPVAGGESQMRLDCPALGLFLCAGDFRLLQGELQTIAYVRETTVEVVDGQGEAISSINMDAGYVAYPTFSAGDELVIYTATIGEGEGGFPFAQPGGYHRIGAPYRAEPGLIAEQDGLLTPYQWFDAQHLIVGLGDAQGGWGAALLGLDGVITPIEPWPSAQPVAVIR